MIIWDNKKYLNNFIKLKVNLAQRIFVNNMTKIYTN